VATIKRILKEAGLIQAAHPPPKEVFYPAPRPTPLYVLHAMDWTARYLEGGPKIFAFHTIDVQTRALHQSIRTDKTVASACQHALETWRTLGLPDGLQLDNDAAFCGGYKAPRIFGQFVRLCLYLGIEPIFIPVGEPKRNGLIERVNGLWSQAFWERHHFHSVLEVIQASPRFEVWYAQHYEPPTLQGQTPAQAQRLVTRRRLTAHQRHDLPRALPITAGRIHFIRRVTAEGQIELLNESWLVGKRLAHQYVWATLVTHERQLRIYHRASPQAQPRLLKEWPYAIPETVVALLSEFRRSHRRRNMFTMF
jgi:transposase InsO family protein